MAVTLTVSQIREALHASVGCVARGDAQPTTAQFGTAFHTVISGLLASDGPAGLATVLANQDCDLAAWRTALLEACYDELLGPWLTHERAGLERRGAEVLTLWQSVHAACDWLAQVWWELTEKGTRAVDMAEVLLPEVQVVREIIQPNWREPVAIVGNIDAVLRLRDRHGWCVIEWKTGRGFPELDLAQACLYHWLLSGENNGLGRSAVSLVRFQPEVREDLFDEKRLSAVQARLIALIGQVAGVTATTGTSRPATLATTTVSDEKRPGGGTLGTNSEVKPQPKPVVVTRTENDLGSWIAQRRDELFRVLKKFGTPCRELKPPVVGPSFVRFFLFPDGSFSNRKVLGQADELHLHLRLEIPPSMGVFEGAITVDLPREKRAGITFSQIIPHLTPGDALTGNSRIPVGQNLEVDWEWCDLAADVNAHVLVVGTPGSGKSEWLRVAVASLIATNTPETLRLLLIDPRQNVFVFAKDSPFLLRPIVVPGRDDVVGVLDDLIQRMEARTGEMAKTNTQLLVDHQRALGKPSPRIVCVCDEYAQLLDACDSKPERSDLESKFRRLAQLGRGPGFHVILATQQPRAAIVSGAIRSLFGAKVVLRVTSPLESRVAMDEVGAERLLGKGDLLYKCIGLPKRLQGAWLPSTEESAAIETLPTFPCAAAGTVSTPSPSTAVAQPDFAPTPANASGS